MSAIFWQEFGILYIAALLGAAAVIPYSMKMAAGKPLKITKPVLYAIAMAQNAVIFAVAICLGLLASHATGLGAPYIEALVAGANLPWEDGIVTGLVTGVLAGAVLLIADLFFEPYWPQKLREISLNTTWQENLLASFYGGINEELLIRFFGFSALIWLASRIFVPNLAIFWLANFVMTILFGLGHLPALKQMLGSLPRLMVARSLILNAPVGLLCGWLFWTYGIEAAIVAHFSVDIVYHVFGTFVLRRRLAPLYL